jgi:integrase
MPRTLTARTVETIKPLSHRQEIPDAYMPGLYLVVQPSGARSWAIRYRMDGRSRKHTIGAFPVFDLAAARQSAAKALRAVAEGRDPALEKTVARHERQDTVEAVVRQFVDLHCRRANKPRTIAGTQNLFDLHVLPRWRNRLIKDITRRDVLDLLDSVVVSGRPVAANRVLSAIGKLFSWCLERDILAVSPCAGVKPPSPEQSRERVLDDAELGNVWRAAEQLDGPFGALIKLLMLTGARRNEIARMEWSEIDLDARLWVLPAARAKNGRALHLPLSEPAIAILTALPQLSDKWVLTTDGKKAMRNFFIGKQQLDALLPADMQGWWIHDLRRSAASGMARLGVNLPVIEKVLNHASGSFAGIVGVYQRHKFETEMAAALESWGRHVLALTRPPERSNIVEFETRA